MARRLVVAGSPVVEGTRAGGQVQASRRAVEGGSPGVEGPGGGGRGRASGGAVEGGSPGFGRTRQREVGTEVGRLAYHRTVAEGIGCRTGQTWFAWVLGR